MDLKFFKKTKRPLSLKSFHQRPISPEKDWLLIILICLICILATAIVSVVLFTTFINTDAPSIDSTEGVDSQSIDVNKLNRALEFINSRGSKN